MSSAPNLVSGRLGRPLASSNCDQASPSKMASSYSMSRLGLRPEPALRLASGKPTVRRRDGAELKKITTRLPRPLANRLKAYCAATGRFQYAAIDAAVRKYLSEAIDQLNAEQRSKMADIAATLPGSAAPAGTNAAPELPAAPQATAHATGDGEATTPTQPCRVSRFTTFLHNFLPGRWQH